VEKARGEEPSLRGEDQNRSWQRCGEGDKGELVGSKKKLLLFVELALGLLGFNTD